MNKKIQKLAKVFNISENEVILKSKKLLVDFIITDHHTVPDVLPEAFSIINPKIKECKYPFKEICAAGVVFNLIVALRTKPPYLSE